MKNPLKLKENLSGIPNIPVKISYNRSGKYYLHVTQLVEKVERNDRNNIVAFDPGVKPKSAYYSPDGLTAGYIGTEVDVEKLIGIAMKADRISSIIATKEMRHLKRYKLRKKQFKLNSKIHN